MKWNYTSGWATKSKAKQVAQGSRKRGLRARVVPARKSTIASAKKYGGKLPIPRYEIKVRRK